MGCRGCRVDPIGKDLSPTWAPVPPLPFTICATWTEFPSLKCSEFIRTSLLPREGAAPRPLESPGGQIPAHKIAAAAPSPHARAAGPGAVSART